MRSGACPLVGGERGDNMEYAKPGFQRVDLMVEHCMCCTKEINVKDLTICILPPQPMTT